VSRVRDSVVAIIVALLSVGGAAVVRNFFTGIKTLRTGARTREREALADLVRQRDDAEADLDFWRRTAGRYAWQLERAGHEPNPANPTPPSERT
jgi:hypothetical protein